MVTASQRTTTFLKKSIVLPRIEVLGREYAD